MPSNSRGLFISFEGCEASGKSTQVALLAQNLRTRGIDVVTTKEPGGTRLADSLRALLLQDEIDDPLTEMLLISAARRDHTKMIQDHLKRGSWVISDRYADSSRVYQGLTKGLPPAHLEQLIAFATDGLEPALTLILDIGLQEIDNRIRASALHDSCYDLKNIEFHARIKEGFLKIQQQYPHRTVLINGSLSREEVASHVIAAIDNHKHRQL